MSQIAQLLLYQQKDSELLKIEQEIAGSEERKKYVQTKNYLSKASEKLDKLEAQSQAILTHLDALNKRYDEISETLKDFDHLEDLVEGGADLSFYQRNISQLIEKIKSLKSEIATLTATAKETTEEYQSMKKKTIAAQKQYPELHAAFQEFKKSKQEQMDAISKELESLAKGIDAEVLRKYQAKRSERIFPIICEIKADRCSKCGIELSIADKDKVSVGGVVECENCHRILYKA
ncbi:MAG: hypothetical protein NC033_03745 [Clostridiales bacterium]|nr:hypothetical protein [Clostridiales bacterium]